MRPRDPGSPRPHLRVEAASRYVLDESIGFLVHRADLALVSHLLERFGRRDITVEQWKVLDRLSHGEGITQRELARRNGQDPTTVARILDKMEKKGLVERLGDRRDRRAFQVTLTPRGRALHAELVPLARDALDDATAGLTDRELQELRRLLRLVYENVVPHPRDDAPVATGSASRAPSRRTARTPPAQRARRSAC